MSNLEKFFEDPYIFLESASVEQLVEIAKQADIAFFNNDEPIMSDDEYDMIYDRIKSLDPSNQYLKKIGAPVNHLTQTITSKNKIILPYKMGSMDKIRPENTDILNNFKLKYKNPYIISDKLDGVSALLIIDNNSKHKLYTRGNGTIGTDITNLLDIINIKLSSSITSTPYAIRGELIISKTKFKKYSDHMANARNMVSGIVNAKTIDIQRAKDVDFVAYELVNPWLPYTEQFKKIKDLKIQLVNWFQESNISVDNLSQILKKRKVESEYECDGIIIAYNSPEERIESGNPDYAFAFKNLAEQETAIVTVKYVEWNISKDGYIKPKLVLNPTKLSGVIIKNVTAFNAKYIVENKIGPNTQIKLVRSGDVIPHILEIIKSSKEPQMPIDIEYEWNDSNVDIVTKNDSIEQKIKELSYFCAKLDIKNVSEGVITKFIDAGIDTIPKILLVTKTDLMEVENFKDKMINKIYDNIHSKIQIMTLLEYMVASNTFGHGLGEKKLKKILEIHPDIIYQYIEKQPSILINLIKDIDGFDTISATQFITRLPKFLELLNQTPIEIQSRILLEVQEIKVPIPGNKLLGLKIVFSGFRNKDWETIIESQGGEITTTISKNTYLLVTTKEDIEKNTNAKIVKAFELGIKVIDKETFNKEYIK